MKDRIKLPFQPRILAYSDSWVSNRLMTVLVPIPTVKLAELRTHRLLSQHEGEVIETAGNDALLSFNANSSRALPLSKQLEMCKGNHFTPIWTRNKKGMQGDIESDEYALFVNKEIWDESFYNASESAKTLGDNDVHKQDAALLLNPYSWTTAVITADEYGWSNFFELRCPKYRYGNGMYYSICELLDLEPNADLSEVTNMSGTYPAIQVIAEYLYDLWQFNNPTILNEGDWHVPFIDFDFFLEDDTMTYISDNYPQIGGFGTGNKSWSTNKYVVANNVVINKKSISLYARTQLTRDLLFVSMSKCAMISYDNQNKKEPIVEHLKRATERLIPNKHVSTAEHQYQVPTSSELFSDDFKEGYIEKGMGRCEHQRGKYISNIKGWKQLRKMIEHGEVE